MEFNFRNNRKSEFVKVMTFVNTLQNSEQVELVKQIDIAFNYVVLYKKHDFGFCGCSDLTETNFVKLVGLIEYTSEYSAYRFFNTDERIEFLSCIKLELNKILAQ